MSYTVRAYKNTGFNATNVPYNANVLSAAASEVLTLPAIDVLQERFLSSIRVRATWSQVENVDYIEVGGTWYYAVDNIKMLSGDVAELALIPDFVLSAGGFYNLEFLDGITERVHVAKNSDTFGAYAEEDPLTAPSEPMGIQVEDISLGTGTSTIIESAIDLIATASSDDALTYTDTVSGETVTVPNFSSLSQYTTHQYGGTHKTASYIVPTPTPGTPERLQVGIDRARSLGVENAIIAQYNVPSAFFTGQTSGFKANLNSNDLSNNTTIPYILDANAKNMRVNYGTYTKFGLLTAGGNKVEFQAEDIYDSQLTYPKILTKADVRKDGCPYHRFETYRGDKTAAGFWRNCVAGAQWEQVPMVYTAKSGGALERLQYEAEKKYSLDVFEKGLETGTYANMIGQMGKFGSQFGPFGVVGGAVTGSLTTIFGAAESIGMYMEKSELDALKYAVRQVITPDIQFPYNTDIMRDALGNGVLAYRYKYSATDLARIDKLLTMYGYRVTKPLEESDLRCRAKFVFVRANGVSVLGKSSGSLPAWWNDGIAAQFSRGIRIWRVKPDSSYYTDGSNV